MEKINFKICKLKTFNSCLTPKQINNFEYIITDEIQKLGLKVINDNHRGK